jgi:O-antigen/teichoic acid export membrane protein
MPWAHKVDARSLASRWSLDVSALWKRVLAALGAQAFGQGVSILIQLASLPLFLGVWDTTRYGVWLMLSAIPAYLSMADVGMVATAGNRMTMAMGRGDEPEAQRIFQSALAFMGLTCALLAVLSVCVALVDPLDWMRDADQRMALAALMLAVVLGLFGGLAEAVLKATGRYAQGTLMANLIRLAEWGGYMLGLCLSGSFVAVAVWGLLMRVVGLLWMTRVARTGRHPFVWGVAQATRQEVRDMVVPAVSFMAFPVANALTFQGVTLVVGGVLGPVAVVVFNTYRTLARVAVQVTGVFGHALWAEFSRLYGQGGAHAVRAMFQRAAWGGLALAGGLSVVLLAMAPWLLQVWTHGRVPYQAGLMLTMLVYAAIAGAWHVPRVLLMSTNQHVALAQWGLAAAAAALGLSWLGARAHALEGVGLAMLVSELGLALMCVWQAVRLTAARPSHNNRVCAS